MTILQRTATPLDEAFLSTTPTTTATSLPKAEGISWAASLPFFGAHAMCLFVLVTGAHLRDVLVCVGLYFLRMFAITGGYHRYFSHRAYKTGRVFQFLLALLGTTCTQKGVLWWAANHRHHHRESDQEADIHSPVRKGFWWSHVGWILSEKYNETPFDKIRDFASFPELRWLNKWHLVPPVLLAAGLLAVGGFSMLIWGFFVSTVLLWHGTFTINSLSHIFGKRRYKTTDTSRNNWLLAFITMGEGWHNNHHYHQNTANQGWFWWEYDFTFYILKALSVVGVVWELRAPSQAVKLSYLKYSEADREQLRTGTPFGGGHETLARVKVAASERVRGAREALVAAAESVPRGTPEPFANP